MRQVIKPQLYLGVAGIAAVQLDPRLRDDIPHLLRALQYIYMQPQVREEVFTILSEVIPRDAEG